MTNENRLQSLARLKTQRACTPLLAAAVFAAMFGVSTVRAGEPVETNTAATPTAIVTAVDLDAAKSMAASFEQQPPFSFTYGGQPSSVLLNQWKHETKEQALDANRIQRITTWKDASSSLSVRLVVVRYADFPAIEWTAYVKNEGTGDSLKVDDLRGINTVIGHATQPKTAWSSASWNAQKDFPKAAGGGGNFEAFRGWVNAWRPMNKSAERFDISGHAPWISTDPTDPTAILMSPAPGIEGATDSAESGKSPGYAFKAPQMGIYRISAEFTMTTNVGDGVEWSLHKGDGTPLAGKNLNAGKSDSFERSMFLNAGEYIIATMNARGNSDGDVCRVHFDVAELTKPDASADVVIHAQKGNDARDTDYMPLPIGLQPRDAVTVNSAGGRGSDGVAMPYFNIQMPGTSALLAIGWPGQWDATFTRTDAEVKVSAGQESVHASLPPGCEIRTPLIAVLPYASDDVQRGQNIWRRWMIAHNMPRVDGKLVGPFLSGNTSHQFKEMTRATEQNQIEYIDAYEKHDFQIDTWWMDAGWYVAPGYPPTYVGTWVVDKSRFPRGLRPISDRAHAKGIKTIVWFEPERVLPGTELSNDHPSFLLSPPLDPNDPSSGLQAWAGSETNVPNVTRNPTDHALSAVDNQIRWQPKQIALHPGKNGEFGVARFTAPADGKYQLSAKFGMSDVNATTDVHVIQGGQSLFAGEISPSQDKEQSFEKAINLKRGETVDFTVGYGANKNCDSDSTWLAATILNADGIAFDARGDFDKNVADRVWTFGSAPAGDPASTVASFAAFTRKSVAGDPTGGTQLLNLGNAEARQWITDRLDSLIKSEAIDIYRQDFNMAPLSYWQQNDAPNRQGITENLYVQGYLKFWDDLQARNPKIFIDSCASGGRRNDLETMRRSTPFLRSDQVFYPTGQQSHTRNASMWLPLNGTGVMIGKSVLNPDWNFPADPYMFRSDMSSITIIAPDMHDASLDLDKVGTYVKQFRDIMPDYLGDYYTLTESSLDAEQWMAWQFNSPESARGFVQAFRREKASGAAMKLTLRGLDRNATYDVVDVDHVDQVRSFSGAQLADEGLNVAIDAQPGAALIRYTRHASK